MLKTSGITHVPFVALDGAIKKHEACLVTKMKQFSHQWKSYFLLPILFQIPDYLVKNNFK